MADIQLILTDIDGTLVPVGSHEVSERVRMAVVAAEQAGISVVPVSGRPYEMAEAILNVLGFDGLCVLDGGASIRKATTGELVWSQWLSPETIQAIMRIIEPHCVLVDYDVAQVERGPEDIAIDLITDAAPYVYAQVHKPAAEAIMRQLAAVPDINSHLLANLVDMPDIQEIQITHAGGNKRHGVQELLRLLEIDLAHVMAVGDGNNDLPLFEAAGLKIAVGNASNELKVAADHVVASVEYDGFAEAVERFVL